MAVRSGAKFVDNLRFEFDEETQLMFVIPDGHKPWAMRVSTFISGFSAATDALAELRRRQGAQIVSLIAGKRAAGVHCTEPSS